MLVVESHPGAFLRARKSAMARETGPALAEPAAE